MIYWLSMRRPSIMDKKQHGGGAQSRGRCRWMFSLRVSLPRPKAVMKSKQASLCRWKSHAGCIKKPPNFFFPFNPSLTSQPLRGAFIYSFSQNRRFSALKLAALKEKMGRDVCVADAAPERAIRRSASLRKHTRLQSINRAE